MKDNGGEDNSTCRNTAFTVESPLFSTVKPKVVNESVTLKIASDTYNLRAILKHTRISNQELTIKLHEMWR